MPREINIETDSALETAETVMTTDAEADTAADTVVVVRKEVVLESPTPDEDGARSRPSIFKFPLPNYFTYCQIFTCPALKTKLNLPYALQGGCWIRNSDSDLR